MENLIYVPNLTTNQGKQFIISFISKKRRDIKSKPNFFLAHKRKKKLLKRLEEVLPDCVASWVHCDQCGIFEFNTKMKILSSHFFDNLRGLVLPSTLNSITKGSAETIWKRWRWQRFKHTSQSLIHITYEHVLNYSNTFPIFANEENNNLFNNKGPFYLVILRI